MKALISKEDVNAAPCPAAFAALGAAIQTGLLWMLAAKPMREEAVEP
jgi:hypothetical protein